MEAKESQRRRCASASVRKLAFDLDGYAIAFVEPCQPTAGSIPHPSSTSRPSRQRFFGYMSSRKRCQRGDGSRLGGEELRPGRPGVTLSLWKIWEAAHSGFSLAGASLVLLFAAAAARGKPKPRLGFSLCCRRQPTSQQQSDDTKHFWVFPRREWRYRDVIFLCVARLQF